jgi:hypothetical protein
MHVDVQNVLVRCAGHAGSKRDPQPQERTVNFFSVLADKYRLVICAIHMHVANVQPSLSWRLYFVVSMSFVYLMEKSPDTMCS